MKFCEMITEVGFDVPLTNLFGQNFHIDRATIIGVEFIVSADINSLATGIPNQGENWFKGMELKHDHYKMFLKPNIIDDPEHVFPFRFIRDKYAPSMELIMKFLHLKEDFPDYTSIMLGFSCTSPLQKHLICPTFCLEVW